MSIVLCWAAVCFREKPGPQLKLLSISVIFEAVLEKPAMVRTAFHSGFSRYPYSSLLRRIGTMAMHGSHAVSSAAGLHSWPVLSSFPNRCRIWDFPGYCRPCCRHWSPGRQVRRPGKAVFLHHLFGCGIGCRLCCHRELPGLFQQLLRQGLRFLL